MARKHFIFFVKVRLTWVERSVEFIVIRDEFTSKPSVSRKLLRSRVFHVCLASNVFWALSACFALPLSKDGKAIFDRFGGLIISTEESVVKDINLLLLATASGTPAAIHWGSDHWRAVKLAGRGVR
jgi:hypothetical protein